MIKFNLIGGGFTHHLSCSSALNKNQYVEWVLDRSADISVHVDYQIFADIDLTKFNIAWIAESSDIVPDVIYGVKNNRNGVLNKFNLFATHDIRLLSIADNFVFIPPNALPWIQNRNIFDKTKNISMIASNKLMCAGHKYRHTIIEKYKDKIDHFGRGFPGKELPWTYIDENGNEESGKMIALKDYRFSIAMENSDYDIIYCEKLTDCFVTGTIPIFWGSKRVSEIFNSDGIIFLEEFNPEMCTEEYYNSKMPAIVENFNIAKSLLSSEDFLYLNYIKD